jgi:hypothetical protein
MELYQPGEVYPRGHSFLQFSFAGLPRTDPAE